MIHTWRWVLYQFLSANDRGKVCRQKRKGKKKSVHRPKRKRKASTPTRKGKTERSVEGKGQIHSTSLEFILLNIYYDGLI